MLELGVVLLVIGVVLVLAPLPLPNVDAVGWVLVIVGVVLVLLAVIDVHDAKAWAALTHS